MEIRTWEEAEELAETYARCVSQAESIEEALKVFCEKRREQTGRERALGPVIVGFERIAAQVKVPSEALQWLEEEYPKFVVRKPVAEKSGIKHFLRLAADAIVETFRAQGVVYCSSYERFFLRLTRNGKNSDR